MTEKKEFKLTPQGSLGVLALGDIGLKLWREVRDKESNQSEEKGDKDGKETGK